MLYCYQFILCYFFHMCLCPEQLYMYAKQLFEEQFIQLGFDDNEGDETVP